MLTYRIRDRIFRIPQGRTLSWPTKAEARFQFSPLQAFGASASGGRTLIRNQAGSSILFNMNTGAFTATSNPPLRPLDVAVIDLAAIVKWSGNVLTVSDTFNSLNELNDLIQSVYFALPMYLNVDFADPPVIDRVEGQIGDVPFGWELMSWHCPTITTTQEQQEKAAVTAWERMSLTSDLIRRRLIAALHYFHVACRLSRQADTPGEFLAEVLLNMEKTLAVLFPPSGDGQTLEAARRGLAQLDYSSAEIERQFIPAMCLRNKIDVGHVDMSIYTPAQLTLIHGYAEQAEQWFRSMLSRLLTKIASGEYDVQPYSAGPPDKDTLRVIERLKTQGVG
jgi:hypothetical protein